jgi:hypothetical protein
VTQKGEAECGITANTVQTVVRDVGYFADVVGAQIGALRRFEVAPEYIASLEWV